MSNLINLKVFKEFVKSSNFGGFLLFLCVIIALVIANSPFSDTLKNLLTYEFGIENNYAILF